MHRVIINDLQIGERMSNSIHKVVPYKLIKDRTNDELLQGSLSISRYIATSDYSPEGIREKIKQVPMEELLCAIEYNRRTSIGIIVLKHFYLPELIRRLELE